MFSRFCVFAVCVLLLKSAGVFAHKNNFPERVKAVSSSVVAIGINSPLKQSDSQIRGTGFVVGDGRWVVTNYHVVDALLDPTIVEYYVAIHGKGKRAEALKAKVVHIDVKHDLALLRIDKVLTPLTLKTGPLVPVGTEVALTGYPIGAVLGLYAATHRGYVAAITPDALPQATTQQMSAGMLSRLENADLIYQLDATAYPGNSGSPLYLTDSGEVVGVLNKVFISAGKESALSMPTGISYAVPIKHVHNLLLRAEKTVN